MRPAPRPGLTNTDARLGCADMVTGGRELVLELAQGLREVALPSWARMRDGTARRRRRRRCDVRGRRGGRGWLEEFVAERAPRTRSTRRTAGWSPPADAQSTCSSSIRSTARGRRWRGWSRLASRSRSLRSATATPTMADVDGRLRGRDQDGRLVPGRAAERACSRHVAVGLASERPTSLDVLGLRLPRPAGAGDGRGAGDLIDASSVGGGTFELGSQAFVMTRIVTGQLDA